jgi:hypothetical protein
VIFDVLYRLEADAHQHDAARGWRAELADPLWLLGRQWQMGEHQGEDASSPTSIELAARFTPIEPVAGQPHLDPRNVPAEAVVESEPGDFWTPGRRVLLGRRVAEAAAADGATIPDDPELLLAGLPVPYDELDGEGLDGRELWRRRGAPELDLDVAWFGEPAPPEDPVDLWNPAELSYSARFRAGDAELALDRHDGGDLEWWSVDATAGVGSAGSVSQTSETPTRRRYPSAPHARWWQIEDARVAIGGHAPDRPNLATLVLIDLIVNQSDDWFTFPIEARAGEIVTLENVAVVDSFGQRWPLAAPSDWSLFATHGLDVRSLVLWAKVATPLVGPVLDEVLIGIDEDANLVWAVENVVAGRTSPTPEQQSRPPVQREPDGRSAFVYRAMTPIPRYRHPYVIEEVEGRRRFVQGRAADLSGAEPALLAPPESDLLFDPASGGRHPVHQLEPAAIPQDGVRVERRAVLARSTAGGPVLWTQRLRMPMLAPPVLELRFDVLDPVVGA